MTKEVEQTATPWMIEKRTLSERVFHLLEEKIAKGEIPHGTRLREVELAEKLATNRACIREALIKLAERGLVERERNRLTRVVTFDERRIRDIFELRLAIEKMCIDSCIRTAHTPREALRLVIQEMTAVENEHNNWMAWVEKDLRFHRTIVEAAGNRKAIEVWCNLESQTKLLFYSTLSKFAGPTSVADHRTICEAMVRGAREAASDSLEAHVRRGCEDAVSAWKLDRGSQ